MYGNSDKPVDFSKKPRDVPRKLQSNVYKELTHRELGFNLGRANPEIEAVAEDKLVTKNYLEMRCELPGQTRSTFLMVFSPDGKKVASTHGNHNVYVTDLTTGKNINTLSGHPRTPWCIAFHPSSNQILATGCLGGQVRVWDLHGGSEVWMAEGQTVIASLAFHPTDRMLVIATYNELHFWDWSQSAPFAKCYTSNEKEKVRYVAFDPLGHKLITGISNVPPHSTQWDRSAGSHHLSHHHHLYHHQPFQRTAARYHAMHCTHHQQSTNVSGERNEDQLERDSRVNDGIPHLSSQREGRTQSSSGEATSTSTSTSASSSNPPQEFERRISVCYRSLAQRYEQLLQRYFDLVRPRLVVTTDRGTDPMEAEETSGSSASAVPADSTNRCSCNNTATNTDNNWTVRNRSGASGTTSNTRARKSTRGFSSSVNSSSSSSSSSVNGTQTTNSHVTSNSCPCFNDINMCRNICQRNSSSSSGICSRTPSTSGTSGSSSTLTCVTGSSMNNANMQSGNSQASPQPVCPIHTEVVPNELSNQDPEGQPLQSANYSSATSSGHKSSGPSRVANENSFSGNMQSSEPSRVANENSLSGNMQSGNRQASPQAVCPRHTGVVPNEVSNQDPGGQPSQSAKYSSVTSSCHKSSEPSRMDRQNSLASPAVRPAESTTTITPCNRMETEQSENATIAGVRSVLRAMEGRDFGLGSLGQRQQDLLPQAQSTISNNPRERHVCQQHGSISRRRNEHRLPRLTLAQVVAGVDATAALYRDVRRLRCGILSLNNQIDSIQSICRARMEVLQLQHIRRTWDNLQHQINTIQRAVTLTPSPYLLGTDTTEEDQPAQVPNVSQLLELTRISDGEPANESSEVRASSSSSGYQNVVRTACDQSETEETASVQASQDCTDDGERPAKRIKLDPQTPSVPTQNELATDGANVSSKVHHSVSELGTSNSDPSVIDEGCKHENISGRNKLESATSSSSQDVANRNIASIQGQSTQGKSEKLVGHNLPVVGLMSASCSRASGSASRNSDSVAGPSKISLRASSLYNSGGGRRGRNVDDVTVRNIVSHQERLNEMQNMVRGLQERLNQRIAERQGFRRLDREREPSYWKFCPRHGTNIARAGSCRNCGARHPRLQPPTVHLGSHLPQPRPIYSTVRPQELVASSQARPANIPPHENISCKSLQQTNSEICTSNCGNVKEEETSCDNKNVCSSKEMTNKPLCGKKHDDTKNMPCVVRTCCMANSSKGTSEEQGENSASSQNNNSKEQEIHAQKHLCGEVTHSQNQVRCSSVTEGVSNSVINKTESVSHSNLVASSQGELPHDTSVINVTNKQNSSCLHSDVNTTPSVENNSVESNPCNPSGNPADLLSETAAYPANMHPFIPGAVTNFCGNLGESSSGHLYTHTLINPTPEDLRSPERRAANSGDQLPQVNPSHRQNDNVHGNESTSTTSHSSRGSDRVVSHSERAPNGLRRHIAPRPNPPIIPRQASLMCPLPDPLIMARPALPTPRASPLLVPGSVQESLRCPPMLHVGGRYYVPRPRFHHRTGHSSRGRILSRPVMPAEQLRRPWFLQTLTQTYRSCAGRSGGELGGRCNEFIRQIGATPRNPVSRPTRNCTSHSQERGSHGNTNQCTENAHTCLRWRQPVESSSENSESTSQASSGNHREVIFENRDETAVNMSKCQALGSTSETSEQSGESSSSKQSASNTSDQLVMPTTMDCAQLPEVEVKQPAHTSDLDNGKSSTDNKDACAGDNTISLPVAEISKSTLSSSCGNNDTEPFCAPLDSSAMKDVTHSTSQTVACKAGHSETAREIVPSSSSSLLNGNGSSSQSTVPDIKENTSQKIAEALLTRSPSESTVPGITENTPQNTAEAHLTQSPSERNEDVNVSQPQESGGRSAATQTPGPPLGRPESVGPSVVSSTPPAQNGASQQMPRYGTGQTVRDIFSRLQRLLDHERMYRQSFMERNRTNSQPTRGSSGAFNTTPAHSNDVWSRWTRRHSDILPERSADDEGLSYSGHAASVAAERLITALQTELCETERLYQRLANLPRSSGSPDQIPGEAAQETTRRRARQVLCSMVESLTQVFEESDPCHTFSRDVSNSRIRVFLSDLYFLLQLSVELVDLLMIQISRPWTRVGTQVENGVENTSNSRQYTRDQISHSRPRGTGSFRFYARRGSSGHRPSDGYSRQPSAGASGTVHPSPVRTLSRHRSGRSLGRGSWVHRFFGASTRFLPGMMQSTAGTDAEIPHVRVVSPVDRDGHGDSERGGAVSRSTYHPLLTRGVRGRFQRGPSTSHHESQQRHNDLFHNFHNYCRQPEEEGQDQQQQQQRDSHPSQPSNHRSEQQRQNPQELEGQQQEEQRQQEQQQQQQQPPEERQHPQQLSPGSGQHDDQSQQQEHLEQQPQDGTHAPERNSEYRSEHSQNQRGSNNQQLATSASQILNSSHQRRQQAQQNSDMFAVPAVQLNDVPIADVGQLSQIEPPHIRPQSPPANPFGVVSRQSHQMLGGLPPSERWLVNFDEVYPNPGFANTTSVTERRLYPPFSFMGYGQGSQSEPSSSRPSTSNLSGSSHGPINNNSPPVNDGHIHRPQTDTASLTYGAPTGWRSRFLHPRYVGPNMFNDDAFASIENFSFIRGPDTVIITDAPLSPNHRIQAWDISKFNIPDISNAEKNIIVSECKIHNDASVDVSKDGTLLVTLLPSTRICVTTMLGIYSLEWESLGQCLYTTSFEQNAVSVSLSPACRHLLVGLASRRIVLPTDRPTVAQIFRMEGAKPGRSVGGRGRLCHLRDIEQNRENSFTSLNCIRWAPEPGQGLVYGTNTGTLRVLR